MAANATSSTSGGRPSLTSRGKRTGERIIIGALALCALISILVTVGIVVALLVPSLEFFTEVSPAEFFTTTKWAPLFEQLATIVAEAPPKRPKPQTLDELLALFSSDVVGRNVVLQPATLADMTGVEHVVKPTLEVVYDAA